MDVVAYGVLAPSATFMFSCMLVYICFDPIVAWLEEEFQATAQVYKPGPSRALLIISAARSLTLATIGTYTLIRFVLYDDALRLVAMWSTVMLEFVLSAQWIRDSSPFTGSVFFLLLVAAVFVEKTVLLLLVAGLAAGSTIRSMDFMHFAINHLFPEPGRGPKWELAMQRSAQFEWFQSAATAVEAGGLVILATHAIWDRKMDFNTFAFCWYAAIMYTIPNWNIYARAPPPVTRDVKGFLLKDLYSLPRLADGQPGREPSTSQPEAPAAVVLLPETPLALPAADAPPPPAPPPAETAPETVPLPPLEAVPAEPAS